MTNYIRAQKFKIEDGVYKFLKYAELEDNIGLHADGIYFSEQITEDGAKWFYYAEDSQTFKKYIKAHENGSFHELIIFDDDKRNRLYFDVDLKHINPNDIAGAISRFMRGAIQSNLELYADDKEQLDDIDISVYEFITDRSDKFSAHYIVPNVYATRDMNIVFAQDINRQARIHKLVGKGVDICDTQVYKPRSQSLRINGFAKYGDTARKQFKPEYSTDMTPDIMDSLVQWRNWYDTATIDYEHNKQFADFIAHNNKTQKFDKTPTMDRSDLPELNKLADILEHLAPKRAEEYKYWIRVCFACAVFGEDARGIMHKWASKAKNYDKAACNRAFDRANGNTGFGTLMYYLKEDAPDYILERTHVVSETDPHIALLESIFSDGDVATYFCNIHKDEFKLYNETLYYFNGCYWEQSSTGVIFNKLNDIYFSLLDKLNTYFGDKKYIDFYNNTLTKKLIKLRTSKNLKNIWDSIKFRIEIKDDIFDRLEDLLGFTNGTYELVNGIFREGRRDDYITRVIPYDFKMVDHEDIDFAKKHFEKVLPDPSIRDLFYITLASGLRGRVLQKFIIWTGGGANSKGVTNKIVRTVFGENLYCKGNNSVLTQEIKGDLSVGIACMHNKRVVIYEEPSASKKIITNIMKELTGGDVMAYRGLYSNNTKTNMHATHIMMCNKKPMLDQIDEAVNRRLIIIPFDSQFRTEDDIKRSIPEGTPNVFIAVDGIENGEFLNKIKLPFLHILFEYYQVFKNNGYQIINVPARCQALVKEYMTASDEFTTWFNDVYEFTNNDDDFVKMIDVYQKYKCSELYQNLDKKTRRLKGSKKAIISDIKENPTLKMYFRERYKKNQIGVDNAMIRYRERNEDSDDE